MKRRRRAIGKPTAAQEARQQAARDIGCIIARKLLGKFIPGAIHHLNVGDKHGQKNRGHDFTICINDWSHQGYPLTAYGWDAAECRRQLGPSFAEQPRAFREAFGGADALLAYQNELLENPPE